MAPAKELNKTNIKKIRYLWLNNKTHTYVAEKLGVARSTYYAFLKEMGLEKYSDKSDEEILAIIDKYQQGNMQTWGYGFIHAALLLEGSMFILHELIDLMTNANVAH